MTHAILVLALLGPVKYSASESVILTPPQLAQFATFVGNIWPGVVTDVKAAVVRKDADGAWEIAINGTLLAATVGAVSVIAPADVKKLYFTIIPVEEATDDVRATVVGSLSAATIDAIPAEGADIEDITP